MPHETNGSVSPVIRFGIHPSEQNPVSTSVPSICFVKPYDISTSSYFHFQFKYMINFWYILYQIINYITSNRSDFSRMSYHDFFSLTDSRNISHQHTGIWMKRRWASINRFLGQVGGGILQRDVNTAGSVRNRTRTMDLNNNIENKLQIINHGRADHPRREMPEQGGQPLRGQVRPHGYPPVPLGVLLRVRQHIVRDHRPRSGRVRGRQGLPGDRRNERRRCRNLRQ